MNKLITKSNYLAGLQCPKRFWAEFNCNDIKIDITPAQQRIINQGLEKCINKGAENNGN